MMRKPMIWRGFSSVRRSHLIGTRANDGAVANGAEASTNNINEGRIPWTP